MRFRTLSRNSGQRQRFRSEPSFCLLLFALVACTWLGHDCLASQGSGQTVSSSRTEQDQYRIWVGDVLDLRVFGHPELSTLIRVDERGMIRLPGVETALQAACRTRRDLAQEITAGYSAVLHNPQVSLRVSESNSPPVLVSGAVRVPQRMRLLRSIRLTEVLALSGGVAENAKGIVRVTRNPEAPTCQLAAPGVAAGNVEYSLEELKRRDGPDPIISPGDVVTVPAADEIYVIGRVKNPGRYRVEMPTTLLQGVALAGGMIEGADPTGVRVCRQMSGKTEARVLIAGIRPQPRPTDEIFLLQADDIVYVPGTAAVTRGVRGNLCKPLGSGTPDLPMEHIIY